MFNFREFVEDTTAAKLESLFAVERIWVPFWSDCCLIPHWWCAAGTNFSKIPVHTGFPGVIQRVRKDGTVRYCLSNLQEWLLYVD